MRLDPSRFEDWFRALNGLTAPAGPFPWQRRLFLDYLCPDDSLAARWPALVQLPTASGKTALIDLAVLALAVGSPCARRRIAFVVNRRVVVDEAAARAAAIAARLRTALAEASDPLHDVAQALVALTGDPSAKDPLVIATLRGGIPADDSWARSPAQPVVVLSTVDQVGSALLLRSYGGGPRSWPLHAGLLGCDTLLIVDEAHCVAPFCETARAIADRWQHFAEQPVAPPLALVRMSATPGEQADFTLDSQDRGDRVLAPRLTAPKPAELVLLPETGAAHRARLVAVLTSRAEHLLESMERGVVGVVVNRVADARAIFEALAVEPDRKLLLTGRVRGWERDRLLEAWLPRMRAGRRAVAERPLVVVATQCIEVGANLDFDALVTEAASLDALRQRFGRLDRLGDRGNARATIVATARQVGLDDNGDAMAPDDVYGHALARTWRWLTATAQGEPPVVDMGISALEQLLPDGDELAQLCQGTSGAYVLLPAHLDLLAQTSPPPDPSPEVAAYLHGTTRTAPDVGVVWRADLEPTNSTAWPNRVAVQPPVTGEACPIPIWAFRRWLESNPGGRESQESRAQAAQAIADVEGAEIDESGAAGDAPVLRWRGFDDVAVVHAGQVVPGDTVVVPAAYRGCDQHGWNPAGDAPVEDIGDAVARAAGRRPVLRLDALAPVLRRSAQAANAENALLELRAWALDEEDAVPPGDALRRLAGIEDLPDWLRTLAALLAADGRRRRVVSDGAAAITGHAASREDVTSSSDQSVHGRSIALDCHSEGVRDYAERFARAVGLGETLSRDVALSGLLHDAGKVDPRFQVWLHGGDEVAAALAEAPLAKSGLNQRDRASIRRARERAGYPDGARHEVASLALITGHPGLRALAGDWDLVQHLVGSSHGYGRPFLPAVPLQVPDRLAVRLGDFDLSLAGTEAPWRIGGGAAERYWRLVRRYGWWGLAWLECIVRLADHRRSEDEQTRADSARADATGADKDEETTDA
jgi:CRISPR-associated endonuclease/helicase Cas3